MSHTPGPWELVDERLVMSGDLTIADALDTREGLEGDCPDAIDNGHLIAAAPDLLAACEAMLAYHLWAKSSAATYHNEPPDSAAMCAAAIKKAKREA